MEDYYDEVYVLNIAYNTTFENPPVDCFGLYSTYDRVQEKISGLIEEFTTQGYVVDENYSEGDMDIILFWQKQDNWKDHIEIITFQKRIDE